MAERPRGDYVVGSTFTGSSGEARLYTPLFAFDWERDPP